MAWSEAPWDSVVAEFPVLQITKLEIRGPDAGADIQVFEIARERTAAGLVSCRLPHERLPESMLLEDHGFRFVEMLYQPELDLETAKVVANVMPLKVSRAQDEDLPALLDIAGHAFQNERFKMDHRLDPELSKLRYCNWIKSSLHHANQQVHVIRDGRRLVAFFVIELLDDGVCYWHLNAVTPDAQGQGYGRRAWLTMLEQAINAGAKRVRTCIVARNYRVLNLYARLGFRFPPPLMTFHWVRGRPD